jgi:hypothetical protein
MKCEYCQQSYRSTINTGGGLQVWTCDCPRGVPIFMSPEVQQSPIETPKPKSFELEIQ